MRDVMVNAQQQTQYRLRGYTNDDVLPKSREQRTMSAFNFCTLWMQSVHNIPNYAAVGAFLLMGYPPVYVMISVILGALLTAVVMVTNGVVGSRYGIPFAMHLRATYGVVGAKLPGFLRGCVAAVCWYGIQVYIGAQALTILLGRLMPGYLSLGEHIPFLRHRLPIIIAFIVFWLINLAIGLGGARFLNKLTAVLSPLIYIVFGAMSIWTLMRVGSLQTILQYHMPVASSGKIGLGLFMMMVVNSVLASWAAPAVSVADFTQHATSTRAQAWGQLASFLLSYVLFAFTSVIILLGGSIIYRHPIGNVLTVIDHWNNNYAIAAATGLLLLTTIATNVTGNIVPAAYQLTALFPRWLNYRKGVLLAAVGSVLCMPWQFLANIIGFLNGIGMLLGPIAGVMIADYYVVRRCCLSLDLLYCDTNVSVSSCKNIDWTSYMATLIGFIVAISGSVISQCSYVSQIAWLAGFLVALIAKIVLSRLIPSVQQLTTSNKGEE